MEVDKSTIENPIIYSLNKISKWQLDHENSKVELPALQRGFVWKVSQIESLWDSILRGFPIGSFLLSRTEDEKLFLLDGQQRATSIALGLYNPWNKNIVEKNNFWSLKNIPIVWIDLAPSEKTNTQKFVIRVITQSHPWGYQRKDNNSILSVSDRRNALKIFREHPDNKDGGYIQLFLIKVFPYDSDLPVPLAFLIKAISEHKENWKTSLIEMCEKHLPTNIKTKHLVNDEINYLDKLKEVIYSSEFDNSIFNAIVDLEQVVVPAIVVKQEILKEEDEQTGEDPTLFVRLNSSGTRIAGEELIYSIYKASFPEAKELVEDIGASYVAPSLVISLVSRLAMSEINENKYPHSISVNDFRKRIKDENFKIKLRELIRAGGAAKLLFEKAFEILLSEDDFKIPPVLVKSIVKGSPDLFLMLLQWIKLHNGEVNEEDRKNILGTLTALSWFGRDNNRYVREAWKELSRSNFWSKDYLAKSFYEKNDFIISPFLRPKWLFEYLKEDVVKNKTEWDELYPKSENSIMKFYVSHINTSLIEDENNKENEIANDIWDNFMNKLFWCKPLVLFAQRQYINESFGEFNQMETLEDTNTPWDWDHIYPASWVYAKWYINPNTKHWTNAIGNFRAMSLEENRSENNSLSPCDRLINVREQSFIKENDWIYWSKINRRINDGDHEMINHHLSAIVHRLCNIYEEWYETLDIGHLFNFEPENISE